MSDPAYHKFLIYGGEVFSRELQIFQDDGVTPLDLSGVVFTSQISSTMLFPDNLGQFTIQVTDVLNGKLTISLTGAQTAQQRYGWAYRIRWQWPSSSPELLFYGPFALVIAGS